MAVFKGNKLQVTIIISVLERTPLGRSPALSGIFLPWFSGSGSERFQRRGAECRRGRGAVVGRGRSPCCSQHPAVPVHAAPGALRRPEQTGLPPSPFRAPAVAGPLRSWAPPGGSRCPFWLREALTPLLGASGPNTVTPIPPSYLAKLHTSVVVTMATAAAFSRLYGARTL